MTKNRDILPPRRFWTAAEHEIVRDLYPDIPCADIAALLQRNPGSIYRVARKMFLKKSEYFNVSDMSGRVKLGHTDPRMIGTRFKPGIVPWNTGTHYTAGGRSAETRFKPGQMPHTTMPIGSYRTVTDKTGRKSLERKISDAKGSNDKRWKAVARLVWEAANGPAPAGCIVVFRPGMHTLVLEQITLDRVECITRKENAVRNHPNRSNPELAKLVQLKGQITRQVNRIQRESRA